MEACFTSLFIWSFLGLTCFDNFTKKNFFFLEIKSQFYFLGCVARKNTCEMIQ